MKEGKIYLIKDVVLKFLSSKGVKGATLKLISQQFLPDEIPESELRLYLDELYIEDYIYKTNISGDRIIYGISGNGKNFIVKGGFGRHQAYERKTVANENIDDKAKNNKKLLFISFESSNSDKVEHIKKALINHPLFEPLIVEDRRRANNALGEIIKEDIKAAYCIIPILSPESFHTQWINQEIGYAVGQGKLIKPIVEIGILKELKGFVHSQNQCPYTYTFRIRPYKSSENKSFMACFKLLIKDLEKEIEQNKLINTPKVTDGKNKKGSNQRWSF